MVKSNRLRRIVVPALVAVVLGAVCSPAQESANTFHNPLLASGPDPWVVTADGFYYYMNTTGKNLTIWKTRDITDLAHAEKKIVWTAPSEGPYSHDIWAPELHHLDGKWYIYFAADAGKNESHRIYVIEKGRVVEQGSHAALLKLKGGLYARLAKAQDLDREPVA